MGYIRGLLQRRLPGTYVLSLRIGASALQVAGGGGLGLGGGRRPRPGPGGGRRGAPVIVGNWVPR